MKNKIILILPALLLTFVFANAQDLQSKDGKKAKTMSFAESNSLNGSVEPIINGIPYSQYKAQQNALKKQQAAQQQVVPQPQLSTVAVADLKTSEAAAPSSKKLPVIASVEDAKKVNKTAELKPVTAKEKLVEPTVPSKLASMTATAADAPVLSAPQTEAVKTKDNPVSKVAGGQYADKTIPGVLAPSPTVSAVGEVPAATTVENVAQPKLPEVLNNQTAPKAEAAIPASVAPAPVKVPEVSKQGSGK